MGVVYKARQVGPQPAGRPQGDPRRPPGRPEELIRFLAEAEAVASIKHPNVVQVYEYGEADGRPFLAMEYLPGGSLADRLKQHGRLDPGRRRPRRQARPGRPGRATTRGSSTATSSRPTSSSTRPASPRSPTSAWPSRATGSRPDPDPGRDGHPGLHGPEQARGETKFVGPQADVYALGVILYELPDRPAARSTTPTRRSCSDAWSRTSPSRPSRRVPGLPRDLEVICLKCLAKDPADRYRRAPTPWPTTCRRFLAGEPILARPVGPATAGLALVPPPPPAGRAGGAPAGLGPGRARRPSAWTWRQAVGERSEKALIADYLADRVLAESSTEVNPRGAELHGPRAARPRRVPDRRRLPGAPRDRGVDPRDGRQVVPLAGRVRQGRAPPPGRDRASTPGSGGRATRPRSASRTLLAVLLDAVGPARTGRGALAREPRRRPAAPRARRPDHPRGRRPGSGPCSGRPGKLDEAEPLLRSALGARRRVLPTDHPDTLRSVRDLCLLEVDRGRLDAAEALADEYERGIRCARGPKHPDNVAALANRGLIQLLQGRPAEAEPFYRRAAEEARRILGHDHADHPRRRRRACPRRRDDRPPDAIPPIPTETSP